VYLSRFADGRLAPVHLLDGLPDSVVLARGACGLRHRGEGEHRFIVRAMSVSLNAAWRVVAVCEAPGGTFDMGQILLKPCHRPVPGVQALSLPCTFLCIAMATP
jgi:hypothetical protein